MKTIRQAHEELIGAFKFLEMMEDDLRRDRGSPERDILRCRVKMAKEEVVKQSKEFIFYLSEAGIKF